MEPNRQHKPGYFPSLDGIRAVAVLMVVYGHAGYFGVRMVFAGLACLVHAVLPFLFVKTGSLAITELHHKMVTHRSSQTPEHKKVVDRANETA